MDLWQAGSLYDITSIALASSLHHQPKARAYYPQTHQNADGTTSTSFPSKLVSEVDFFRIGEYFFIPTPYTEGPYTLDSFDWSTTIVKGANKFDSLYSRCGEDNTKPAIISNQLQFEKFKPKLKLEKEFWLGLRQTAEGIFIRITIGLFNIVVV